MAQQTRRSRLMLVDPKTPRGKLILRYRGWRTEHIVKALGLPPLDDSRPKYTRDELINMIVDIKMAVREK